MGMGNPSHLREEERNMAIVSINGLVIGAVSIKEYTVQQLESAGFTVIIPE